MTSNYETLEEYLDALDTIKEKAAEETEGMSAKQVKEYYAQAARKLQQVTGQKVRVRRQTPRVRAAKR
jgi:hypothetical protein